MRARLKAKLWEVQESASMPVNQYVRACLLRCKPCQAKHVAGHTYTDVLIYSKADIHINYNPHAGT